MCGLPISEGRRHPPMRSTTWWRASLWMRSADVFHSQMGSCEGRENASNRKERAVLVLYSPLFHFKLAASTTTLSPRGNPRLYMATRAAPVATLATPTGNQRPACGQTGPIRQDMKNPAEAEQLRKQIVWCGRRESNPHERSSRDFKSLASTNSATSAPLLFSLA